MNRSVHHGGLIVVGDGQKALFLRNAGDEIAPNLTVERVLMDDNPPTHDQGTDRPGRSFKSGATSRRAGMDTTDWHELGKHRFAHRVASALEQLVRAQGFKEIIIVAPPRTLAELRRAFHSDVKSRIIAEVGKDLTKQRVWEIEKTPLGKEIRYGDPRSSL
jgi:protein required for attachment to host cells